MEQELLLRPDGHLEQPHTVITNLFFHAFSRKSNRDESQIPTLPTPTPPCERLTAGDLFLELGIREVLP